MEVFSPLWGSGIGICAQMGSDLGDKADSIKKIAGLKTKELNIESECVKTRAAIATLDLDIKKLNKKVNLQASKVDSHK